MEPQLKTYALVRQPRPLAQRLLPVLTYSGREISRDLCPRGRFEVVEAGSGVTHRLAYTVWETPSQAVRAAAAAQRRSTPRSGRGR